MEKKTYKLVYEMQIEIEASTEQEAKDIWESLNLNGSEHESVSYEYRELIATYENDIEINNF